MIGLLGRRRRDTSMRGRAYGGRQLVEEGLCRAGCIRGDQEGSRWDMSAGQLFDLDARVTSEVADDAL